MSNNKQEGTKGDNKTLMSVKRVTAGRGLCNFKIEHSGAAGKWVLLRSFSRRVGLYTQAISPLLKKLGIMQLELDAVCKLTDVQQKEFKQLVEKKKGNGNKTVYKKGDDENSASGGEPLAKRTQSADDSGSVDIASSKRAEEETANCDTESETSSRKAHNNVQEESKDNGQEAANVFVHCANPNNMKSEAPQEEQEAVEESECSDEEDSDSG